MKLHHDSLQLQRVVGLVGLLILVPLVVLVLWSCERIEDPTRANPLDPANLQTQGNPFSLRAELSANHDTVTLRWDAVAVSGVKGYRVLRSLAGNHEERIWDVAASGTAWADAEIDAGRVYAYKLAALDSRGRMSQVDSQEGVYVRVPPPGFVYIPPGTFMMGSSDDEPGRLLLPNEGPQHWVTLTQGFYMSQYEVTEQWWYEVMSGEPTTSQLPNTHVSWDMAVQFCNALSVQQGLTPAYTIHGPYGDVTWNQGANGYRLPTEAEWEYACRATTTMAYHNNTNCLSSTNEANFRGDSDQLSGCPYGVYRGAVTTVGSFPSNQWGLYDMHGNLIEWVWCGLRTYTSSSQVDPVHNVDPGGPRVVRGGLWYLYAQFCRSAAREYVHPGHAGYGLGFRPVRSAF